MSELKLPTTWSRLETVARDNGIDPSDKDAIAKLRRELVSLRSAGKLVQGSHTIDGQSVTTYRVREPANVVR